jgi:hypothetical protein
MGPLTIEAHLNEHTEFHGGPFPPVLLPSAY